MTRRLCSNRGDVGPSMLLSLQAECYSGPDHRVQDLMYRQDLPISWKATISSFADRSSAGPQLRNGRHQMKWFPHVGKILKEVTDFYRRTKVTEGLIELRNLACVADIIIRSALMRHESRGLHYTTDYPKLDDEHCLNDTIITSDLINEKTATR